MSGSVNRGLEIMVLDFVKRNRGRTIEQISEGTGCTVLTVKNSLAGLMSNGLVSRTRTEYGRRKIIYNAAPVVTDEFLKDLNAKTIVCGKQYDLTGQQMQAIRDVADGFVNRGGIDMDWDGNQEIIRKELDRAEVLVGEMAYEDDLERRLELCIHIQRSIIDVLHMTENMTRHLRRGDAGEDQTERMA